MKFFNTKREIEKDIRYVKKIQMKSGDKSAMRKRLMSYADTHVGIGVKSPYWQIFLWSSSKASERFAYAIMACLVLVMAGGISFASEESLPGDSLYSMKVDVTEPVRTVLTVNPVEQVRWQGELANRRLTEAAELESQGRLDATITDEIQQSFTQHQSSIDSLEKEAAKTPRLKAIRQAQSDFQAKTQKNQAILNVMQARLFNRSESSNARAKATIMLPNVGQKTELKVDDKHTNKTEKPD